MEQAVKALGMIVFIFLLVFLCFDLNRNSTMKQTEYESTRSANQGSLKGLQKKYNNYETITTAEMLEEWLVNFIDTYGLEYESVKIGFVQINSEPAYYLVTIEGYEKYAIITKDAYVKYSTGAMIVTKDED